MNEKPIFEALLTPHRSLGKNGFIIFATICAGLFITNMFVYLMANAWPVAAFLGLDFALLLGAFWLNYRSGRIREEISVSRSNLKIRKVAASGKSQDQYFNPLWAKFNVSRHNEIGITDMSVCGQNKRVHVGSFLNPVDRESFASAFGGALALAKKR